MVILKGPFLSLTGMLQLTVQSSIISKEVIGPLVASEVVFRTTIFSYSRATVFDALNLIVLRVFTTLFSLTVESILLILSAAGSLSSLLRVSKCLLTFVFKRLVCSEILCFILSFSDSSVINIAFCF